MSVGAITTIALAGIAGVVLVEAMSKGYNNLAVNAGDKSLAVNKIGESQEVRKIFDSPVMT